MEFEGFGKIPRLSRDIVITEKIDGSNAQIFIEAGNPEKAGANAPASATVKTKDWYYIIASGSRNRWITPEDDNYGFAAWVRDNAQELFDVLGPGRHFGEWWGSGINRGYGLLNGEKRFSLFNTGKWNDENKPSCCSVVPVLYEGMFSTEAIDQTMQILSADGSYASPGFMNPEGIIIYHTAANSYFKKTVKDDEKPKSSNE